MSCESTRLGELARTSLSGYVESVIAEDPPACFLLTLEDYIDKEVLLANIEGQQWPIHICGTTNTGWNFDGCGHGAFVLDECNVELTGERVIAQGCKLDCVSNLLDPSKSPVVLVGKIDGQWHIVSVLNASSFVRPDTYPDHCFEGLCCHEGLDIRADISGGDAFDGESLILEARTGSLTWTGSLTIGDKTLTLQLGCQSVSGVWNYSVLCNNQSATLNPPPVFDCDSTDGGLPSFIGSVSGCMSQFTITLTVLDTSFINRCTYHEGAGYLPGVLTGDRVIAEACGLPDIKVGDLVIVAEVDTDGTGTGTGTGNDSKYHIITACGETYNCGDCPPPPPPPTDCCGLNSVTGPTSLVGIATFSGSGAACQCPDELAVVFELVVESDPPEWIQVGVAECQNPGSGAGSDDASVLQPILGLRITCGGETTATNTGTGTGASGRFFLTGPGCAPNEIGVESSLAVCDPLYMEFNVEIESCCDAYNQSEPLVLVMHLEVTEG